MAVIFERDCGATTDFSTQVSILPPGEVPTEAGNIFVATPGRGPGAAPGRSEIHIEWLGPRRLRIRYRRGDQIFKQLGEGEGVSIEYIRSGN